jgi:fructose-specific phosphotransferase system IIC component
VDPLFIPIVAILMPLLLVPSILVLKHRHKRREWEHRERMRAMEGPLPLMRTAAGVGSGGVGAIGAGVPVASVAAAFLTTVTWDPTTPGDVPMPAVAWGCAVVISVAGLVTSLLLALLQARTQRQMESALASALHSEKPTFDPDTFDVVGSRC